MDTLLRHEFMPQPLGKWLGQELECGVGADDRLLLIMALQGLLGIPAAHRETPDVIAPVIAAAKLADAVLIGNTRCWTIAQVSTFTARLAKTDGIDGFLRAWCQLRVTHRALEKVAAAERQLRFADGRPATIPTLAKCSPNANAQPK